MIIICKFFLLLTLNRLLRRAYQGLITNSWQNSEGIGEKNTSNNSTKAENSTASDHPDSEADPLTKSASDPTPDAPDSTSPACSPPRQ
jgi:hypothetical protein